MHTGAVLRRAALLADIADADILERLGWRIRLRPFRLLHFAGATVLFCGIAGSTYAVSLWCDAELVHSRGRLGVAAAIGVPLYLVVLQCARSTLTSQHEALVTPPHAAFLRALDFPRSLVILIGHRHALGFSLLFTGGLSAGALAAAQSDAVNPIMLVAAAWAPLGAAGTIAAVMLGTYAWRTRAGRRRRRPVAVLLLATALGSATGALLAAMWSPYLWARGGTGTTTWAVITTVSLAVGIAGYIAVIATLRHPSSRWDSGREAARTTSPRSEPGAFSGSWWAQCGRRLRDADGRVPLTAFPSICWAAGALVVTLILLVPSGNGQILLSSIPPTSWCVLAVAFALSTSDMCLRVLGPARLGPLARLNWELGGRLGNLASLPLCLGIGHTLASVLPLGVMAGMSGHSPVPPLALSVATAAVVFLAEALLVPDSSVENDARGPSMAAGLLTALMAAAFAALGVLTVGSTAQALIPVLALLTVGGALLCSRSRIRHLPWSSVTSPAGTVARTRRSMKRRFASRGPASPT